VKKEPVVKKKQFDENIENEVIKSPQGSFRIDYFLYIVDKAITHSKIDLNNLKYMKIFLVFYLVLKI